MTMPQITLVMRDAKAYLALFAICLSFSGCSPGQNSFLMVQFCLGDRRNLVELTQTLKSIAQQEHLEFIDDSSVAKKTWMRAHHNVIL